MSHKVGELRPTQLLHTYGVGAMIDLPNIAALVMGLEDWDTVHATPVGEERLLKAVRTMLGNQVQRLLLPPIEPEQAAMGPLGGAPVGVPVAAFPQWFRCPHCERLAPKGSGLFQLKTDPYRPDRARYVHINCTKAGAPPTALPSRFEIACAHGHIDDFPWLRFVHKGTTACNGPLKLLKMGASDEAVDLLVRCETCGAQRVMGDAFGEAAKDDPVFACRGRRPHLRDFELAGCDQHAETILLGASNAWFAISLSALSIPRAVDRLAQLVEERWVVLQHIAQREFVAPARAMGNLRGLEDYPDDAVWEAVVRHRSGAAGPEDETDLKSPEWEVFSAADPARNSRDFELRPVAPPVGYERWIEKVVMVERLREVRALTGFTRIDSPGDYADPTDIPPQLVAPISRARPTWVPVSEVRGEGLFIQFREDVLSAWLARETAANAEFLAAHRAWRKARRIPDPDAGYPGLRYVLIHSFSHALMRELAIESGYSAASIRERIYASAGNADRGAQAGLLLYTAAPDSEGTLGGLVALGHPARLGGMIRRALEAIGLCSSDPLCAEHSPRRDGVPSLHAAACHACMFVAETSCERGNKYLDRRALVMTLGSGVEPFFRP